jgi:UPF0755 protein
MRARRRSAGCLLGATLAVVAICLAGFIAFRAGRSSLGPPARSLPTIARTVLGAYLMLNRSGLTAAAGDPERVATLDIEPGQDAQSVVRQLEDLGVVDRPELFSRYLTYRGLDTGIEAGRYEVSGAMSILELSELLQQARSSRYTLTIPEGWRREQVALALGQLDLGFSAADFLEATHQTPPPWTQAPASVDDLEGFLFPDTYQLDPGMTAGEVVEMMVTDFEGRLSDDLLSGFAAQGLTPFEAVVLASIVEREAILASERPLIASVFLNRLALGIPLQADPTVQYPLGRPPDGWWKAPLSAEDLQVDSPYNTYLQDGLPPGPIASPGLASLESVAAPAGTAYLFFRATCDGSGRHLFATTFEEHLANACP